MSESASRASVLDRLMESLRARVAAPDGQARPAAILWTDPRSEWLAAGEVLRERVPELLILGGYGPASRTGPSIWLRCLVDRVLEDPQLPEDRPPILYLPGVARQHLRAAEDCPDALKPLVELMFRGTLWVQPNGSDWTVAAFLSTSNGLGLDIARDQATSDALLRALREVLLTPVPALRGRRLQADDFDRLLTGDVIRDLLRWMGDPAGTRARLGPNGWAAFCSRCREERGFDPERESDVDAGERLGVGEGPWAAVWERFLESPTSYGDIAGLLRRSKSVSTPLFERERWPDLNEDDEETVRRALVDLPNLGHSQACQAILDLEREHARRRDWVWARVGLSPMAGVLQPLARLATAAGTSLGGMTPDDIAAAYAERGWQADAAGWEAVAKASRPDKTAVAAVVRHLLEPWLRSAAEAFQQAVERAPLRGRGGQPLIQATDDQCILFADGLRYDVGLRLAERLEAAGCRVDVRRRWGALPTVTGTAKPAVTPLADGIHGETLTGDFAPRLTATARPASAVNLRDELAKREYQVLGEDLLDAPLGHPARGWMEIGEIDRLGHRLGSGLADRLCEEIEHLADRILRLLDAGWQSIRVVTDHGWLLLPGGLPKVDLPKHLTETRWARCAVVAGDATPAVLRAPWHWNPAQWFATAPGIACFKASEEYTHGGLSIQECLTPDLLVERAGEAAATATIVSIAWRRLRCLVDVTSRGGSITADLRLEKASGPSVVASPKPLEADGAVSLVLASDEHETANLVLVLLGEDGRILAHQRTRVGVDS